jgi:hypothetical protein
MNKLTKSTPAWHAEAVELLNKNFNSIHTVFLDATKKAIWMGLFLAHIKARGKEDGSIPHGQFCPWLKKNVPDLSRDTVSSYLLLAKNVAEKGSFKIRDFPQFASNGQLPPSCLKVIEGKTQQQLFLEFKQGETDDDGNLRAKRGQLKGSKGCTKADRAAHAELTAQQIDMELSEEFKELTLRLLFLADAKGIGSRSDIVIQDFCDAADAISGFGKRTLTARKGK